MLTHVLGYPSIGAERELKKVLESYWSGQTDRIKFEKTTQKIKEKNWKEIKLTGVDYTTVGDFSLYDQMLDISLMAGIIPDRFQNHYTDDYDLYFSMARGDAQRGLAAMEMTKWFDTNYHYIVPEFSESSKPKRSNCRLLEDVKRASSLGYNVKPVLIGPLTYLSLGKEIAGFNRWELLPDLLHVYTELIAELAEICDIIQIDEPILVTDISAEVRQHANKVYEIIHKSSGPSKLMVATYFEALGDNLELFLKLPCDINHFDCIYGEEQISEVVDNYPATKSISLGVINGRNIWKTDLRKTELFVEEILNKIPRSRVMLSSSCSLKHSPVDLSFETKIPSRILNWLAFSLQKCEELSILKRSLCGEDVKDYLDANSAAVESRRLDSTVTDKAVRERCAHITEDDKSRLSKFTERQQVQSRSFDLPALPTTTIGSFPQEASIRKLRRDFKKGEIAYEDYQLEIQQIIQENIKVQEDIGIDVLVHGEPERNDMVEYFGEQLNGFCFTANGWVQSYGSRCVKPPIIYGDVSRPKAMTVDWTSYADSLSDKPVKGMLTGPVTILCWSFVRDDLPKSDVCQQIALAIRDEVNDLEEAGIKMIQIDEAAFREGMPLKAEKKAAYLNWAVECFRLCSSSVDNATQIHTHMCYSDFNSIAPSIAAMDADVISIEASRSGMKLLDTFKEFEYPNEIGPGIYDIHSPRVPGVDEMVDLLRQALTVIPKDSFWINPDCGLKTRHWKETKASLRNMVKAAEIIREEIK